MLTLDRPVFGLARIRRATVLLDRRGLQQVSQDGAAGTARLLDVMRGRGRSARARAEGAALAHGIARWRGVPGADELALCLGASPRYLSVGHSGLDARCLGAVAALPEARCGVFLHDAIPLDFPQMQKAGTPERFRQKLRWVGRTADIVFTPGEATSGDIAPHLETAGFSGPVRAAPPGVRLPEPGLLPAGLPSGRPYFVALGTIEPRKNHALLLDLWDEPDRWPERPALVIAGRRGWRNEAVFERLDALVGKGDVFEFADLDDPAVDAVLAGARGLLFPSVSEGYGLPPLEAARLGTPVVATPLAQLRERLGDWPVYADPAERYQWREAVGALLRGHETGAPPALPDWPGHFNGVLSLLG